MNTESLEALIRAGDALAVERELLDVPRAERAGLRRAALDLKKQLFALDDPSTAKDARPTEPQRAATWTALFLTSSFADLRSHWWWGLPTEPDLVRLTGLYQPPWLPELVERLMLTRWRHVRALVLAGRIPEPDSRAYTLGMLGVRCNPLALLLEDEALRYGALWRVFTVEGEGEYSLSAMSGAAWIDAMVTLSSSGLLPRDRLLDASLQALTRGVAKGRAAPFERLHEHLMPTAAEQSARASWYLDLLAVGHPTSQRLALHALDVIGAELDPHDVVGALANLTTCPTKALAIDGIRRIDRLADASPSAAVHALASALSHPQPDVQRAALRALASRAKADPTKVADAVAASLDLIAPSLRDLALALCPDASLPPSPPPAEPTPARVGPLDPARRLRPLPHLVALVHTLAHTLEHPDDVEAIEQVLEAMATLPVTRDATFATLTDGLRLRATQLPTRPRRFGPASGATPRSLLAWLTTSWVLGRTDPPPPDWPRRDRAAWGTATLWIARLEAVVRRFDAPGLTPLATPTHRDLFVDPVTLVERLRERRTSGLPIDPPDLLTALQRLPPGAACVLDPIAEPEAALAWAMGQDAPVGGEHPVWWVAAARHRGTADDLATVQDAFAELAGVDLSDQPAGPTWRQAKPQAYGDEQADGPGYTVTCWSLPATDAVRLADRPSQTYQLHGAGRLGVSEEVIPMGMCDWSRSVSPEGGVDYFDRTDCGAVQPWNAALVPGQPEGFLTETLLLMLAANASTEVFHHTHQGLAPLRSPAHRWSRWSWWVLAAGLGSRAPESQAAAVDALLASLAHGAFDPTKASVPLRELLFQASAPAGRFATSLGHVVAAGPPASRAVRDLLLHTLTGTPARPPRDLAKLLTLLHECCAAEAPSALPPGFEELVAAVGSGAAGKAGRSVVQMVRGGR